MATTSEVKKMKEIHPQYQGKPVTADTIACCPNGDMVIAHFEKLYLLKPNGKGKVHMTSQVTGSQKELDWVWDVAVSHQGHILVVRKMRNVQVFDENGKHFRCFSNEYENNLIAMDWDQNVVIGDTFKEIMTVHAFPSGDKCKEIMYDADSKGVHGGMVVNTEKLILNHFTPHYSVFSRVEAIDYSGRSIFTFTPKIDEDLTAEDTDVWPGGIVCDAYDNIYITMKVMMGSISQKYTGHLHKYSSTGAFQGCLAKDMKDPWDLSITSDGSSLAIANEDSILIFPL